MTIGKVGTIVSAVLAVSRDVMMVGYLLIGWRVGWRVGGIVRMAAKRVVLMDTAPTPQAPALVLAQRADGKARMWVAVTLMRVMRMVAVIVGGLMGV